MRLHNVWYLIRSGVKNVFKNGMMSFSCIGVLVACMLLIGCSVFFTLTVNNIVGVVEQNNEIVADLEKGASSNKVEQELANIAGVVEINFISKEEALESLLSNKLNSGKSLMEGLEADKNPLPDRFVIRLENTERVKQVVAEVGAIKGVEEVRASEEVVQILSGIKQTVYYSGIGIVGILVIVSLAIITNTIKITILSRKREINIMKYVGATDMFIRLPFLVEGILIGIIAACLSFIILGVGYPALIQWATVNYGNKLPIIFNNAATFEDVGLELFIGFSIMGTFIGVLSSTVFVRKHLRV